MKCTFSAITLVSLCASSPIPAMEPGSGRVPCAARLEAAAVVEAHLPAFTLPGPGLAASDPCSQVVTGDFNGDGVTDLAAVLTEARAPRRYANGRGQFRAYVFVFLRTRLPYADHAAVLLLGYASVPRRMSLQAVVQGGKGAPDRLIVRNATYSRTVYEWRPTGFVVLEHEAD
jgi:hypothetical protein